MTRGRARRYLLTKQGYYPAVVASMGYDVWDWSTLNAGTLFQDSAKTTPATANGDVVGCWVDRVKLTDATQATTAVKPTFTTGSLNGLPTLSFDGGDGLVTSGNIVISTFAVWVVADVNGTNDMVVEHSANAGTTDGMYIFNTATNNIRSRIRRTSATEKEVSATTPTAYTLYRVEHNGTQATHLIYFDGSLQSTTAIATADIGTGTATQPLYIGARSGVQLPLNGNIAQLCVVSPYPTDASIIANMESYINSKWSVY